MGDIMTDQDAAPESTEPPALQEILGMLDQMGLNSLSLSFRQVIARARTFVADHPELVETLVRNGAQTEAPNDAPGNAPDFGIGLEQEFLIRDDKGESQAVLYFEEIEPQTVDDVRTMWIDSFSVAKALRGQGVGKALMRRFLERYGLSHVIFLRARPFNDAPMSRSQLTVFYHNWGFEELLVPTVMVRYPHLPRYKGEQL
jgi:GNAT superfamily N-acetyltransferase